MVMATTTTTKTRRTDNVWFSEKDNRWHWEVNLKRKNGTYWRKAGSSKKDEKSKSVDARDAAIQEFERTEGRGGDWTIRTYSEHLLEKFWPGRIAPNTLYGFGCSFRNWICVEPERGKATAGLGPVKLGALTVQRVQTWADDVTAEAGLHVARVALTALSSLLSRALKEELVKTNVAQGVELQREDGEDAGKMILDRDQQQALVRAAKGHPLEMLVLIQLNFGVRMGEALGLQWSDLDLQAKTLKVVRQLQKQVGEEPALVPLKSDRKKSLGTTGGEKAKGARVIPIADGLLPILQEARSNSGSTFVCSTPEGLPWNPKRIAAVFRQLVKEAGFTKETGYPTTHDLRSTCISRWANETSLPVQKVSYFAGHSKIETTMRFYIRVNPDDARDAMQSCVVA